jgi:protocatechuate 3,4-dioxygenase beta subunit
VKGASPRERIRAVLAAAAVVFVAGGIPGAPARWAPTDVVAPSVPPEVEERDGRVEVAVRDAAGPLRGARVQVLSIVDDTAYLADARDTDAAGHARFERLPEGEVWILANASGHARASSHAVLTASPRLVEMTLDAEHWVDVSVADEEGSPVAGARIEATAPGDDLPFGATTGPDGAVRVGRLPTGPWRLEASAVGFDQDSTRASRDGEKVRLVLRKLATISVHVAGGGDEGAKGAHVSIAGATLWPARVANADDQGNVSIGGLAAGSYSLRAAKGGWVSPVEFGVALSRGETKGVTLRLAPGRFVGVLVTDGDLENADPIAGVRLTLAEGGLSPFPIEATSDARGRARLGPIAPGTAALGAHADGYMPRGGVPVADPPPAETRVALVRAGVLTGTVVDARGDPVDGATIEIVGSDASRGPVFDDPRRSSFQATQFEAALGGPLAMLPAGELGVVPGPVAPVPHGVALFGSARAPGASSADAEPWVTDANGEFRAVPASPGRVRAVVRHPQYVEAESGFVTLAPGGTAHVDVVMHAGGTLEGRVVDAHDMPVEGARILVSALLGATERTTRSARDGTFAFASLPESVSLTATAGDGDDRLVRMTASVPEGGRQEVVVRLPEARDPLPVTVVDDGGWPVDAVQLSAVSLAADAPLRATAFTDSHGEAALKGARGVALRVEARVPGHAPSVTVTDGTSDSLRIELAPAETATGEVVTARGRDPVAGAEVALYTDLGVRRARTDAHGVFALSELAPGRARMRVRAPGFAVASIAVEVPDSRGRREFAAPRVELAEAGVVDGEVVDARGQPVAGARVAQDRVPTWLLAGSSPEGVAVTNANGAFSLGELAEGAVALEAYAPDVGRGHVEGVRVVAGRTTDRVRILLASSEGAGEGPKPGAAQPTGSVAVTLGETSAPTEVVVVSVVEGSEAERAGLAPGDVLLDVDGTPTRTMGDARARFSGPIADDVLVHVRRGDQTFALRAAREAVRR